MANEPFSRAVPGDSSASAESPSRWRPSSRSFRFDTSLTALTGLSVHLLSGITGPLLARNLGAGGRGSLAAVTVPAEIFGWLLCFGIPIATLYYAREHEWRHLLMSSWVFSYALGGIVILATWWAIPSFLDGHPPETVTWLRAFLLVNLAVGPVTTAVETLTLEGAIVAYNILVRFPYVVYTIGIAALAIAGSLDLPGALAVSLGANVLWFAAVIAYRHAWPGRGFRFSVLRRQLHYGSRVFLGSVSTLTIQWLDRLLLVGLVSPSALGIYVVSSTAAGITGPLSEGLAVNIRARLLRAGAPSRRALLARAMAWSALVSITASIGIAVLAPWVLPALFGAAFDDSLHPLWILLPGQCALNVANIIGEKLIVDGRPGTESLGLGIAAITTVVALVLLVPPFGILGAAAATTLSEFVLLGYVWIADQRGPRRARAPS